MYFLEEKLRVQGHKELSSRGPCIRFSDSSIIVCGYQLRDNLTHTPHQCWLRVQLVAINQNMSLHACMH
jgi:hypothetical protein